MRGEHLEGSMTCQIQLKNQAEANLARAKKREAEKEELVRQGKMRKIITKVGDKMTIVKYERIY